MFCCCCCSCCCRCGSHLPLGLALPTLPLVDRFVHGLVEHVSDVSVDRRRASLGSSFYQRILDVRVEGVVAVNAVICRTVGGKEAAGKVAFADGGNVRVRMRLRRTAAVSAVTEEFLGLGGQSGVGKL